MSMQATLRTRSPIAGLLVVGLAAAAAFAGCSSPTSSTGPPATRGTRPRCSLAAISKPAKETPSIGPVRRVTDYGCSGNWAYAGIVVGTSSENSYEAVIVLKAEGGAWVVFDRARACLKKLVPASIYGPACTTS